MTQAVLLETGRGNTFVDDTLLAIIGTQTQRNQTMALLIVLWRMLGLRVAWRKVLRGPRVTWIGAAIEVDNAMRVIYVSIPADKLADVHELCVKWITGTGMISAGELRQFAGKGSWMGGILPQLRPFVRQLWGALAAQRSPATPHLVHKRQVLPALEWIRDFAAAGAGGITRKIRLADRGVAGPAIATDASPWGGGAVLYPSLAAYKAGQPPTHYIEVAWTDMHERIVQGLIGLPDHQASWEALMLAIAIRTWVSEATSGKVALVSDASGVLQDIVSWRARGKVVNNIVKQIALHLAPIGLELCGLHVWSERNKLTDALSRSAQEDSVPESFRASTVKVKPAADTLDKWKHCVVRVPHSKK